jgi:hypothetical protein
MLIDWFGWFMVFNVPFNNISVISWWSVLLMEETGVLIYLWYKCQDSNIFIVVICLITTGEVNSIQHYVKRFVSDLRKVGGFLWVPRFPPSIKLTKRVRVMVFNATFNNISVISWRSVLLMEETGGPGENHRPVVSH